MFSFVISRRLYQLLGFLLLSQFLFYDFDISQDVAAEVEQIHKTLGGVVDVSFDCAGFNKTMSTALSATRAGGKVCLVGMGHHEMTVPLTPAAARYLVLFLVHYIIFAYSHNANESLFPINTVDGHGPISTCIAPIWP